MGGFVPPNVGGQKYEDKALMGGIMRGDIDLMEGGPNFDRLYHTLKVLLLLSCNYTICILSLSNSHNNAASIQKHRGDELHHVIIVRSLILL